MDEFGRAAIGFVGTSLVCVMLVFIALSAGSGGSGDGSTTLPTILGFSAGLGAFVGGLVGLAMALGSSLPRDRKRRLVVLSLPGLLCPVWAVVAVVGLAAQMN